MGKWSGIRRRAALLALACALVQPAQTGASAGLVPADAAEKRIAIVIDDFGNGMKGTEEMFRLPVKFTVAVMPFLPTSAADAKLAHRLGHEVIVHLPMEPVSGRKEWLGPGAILTSLSDGEIRRRVEAAVDNVPFASGMNNHMGSKATADKRVMRIVLDVCRERGLYFLDSRTTAKSVARETAESLGVPYASNDLFLDDRYAMPHIVRQLEQLHRHLRNHPTGVAIGHVGPPGKMTAEALRQAIPQLRREAEFVRVSSLARGGRPGALFGAGGIAEHRSGHTDSLKRPTAGAATITRPGAR